MKEGLEAGSGRLGRLTQRPFKLSAGPGAAGIGEALRRRQESVNGPEAAGCSGFTVVGCGGPEGEVHRCDKPLAGVALPSRRGGLPRSDRLIWKVGMCYITYFFVI